MNRHEEMSSWMDGEADGRHAESMSSTVLNDADHRKRWNEWHLIGDVMRSASLGVTTNVADRVAARLASEPLHMAPRKPQSSRRDLVHRSRVAAAVAAVAAVAFVALVALAPQMHEGGVSGLIAATGLGGSTPAANIEQASVQVMPDDPRLREALEAHGSMSIRPVSIEVR